MRNEETRRQAVALRFYGYSWTEISSRTGINERTLRQWSQTDWWQDFRAECEAGEAEQLAALARRVARDKLIEGDGTMARFILERMGGRRFAPPSKRVEIEGNVAHSHERKAFEGLPTAVIERMADEDEDVIDAFFEEERPLLEADDDEQS